MSGWMYQCILILQQDGKVSKYFVLNFSPGKLSDHELNQHVEEGPQVVMATHLLQRCTDKNKGTE